MIDPELRRACDIVASKDTQPLRRALFAQLASRTPAVKAALAAWRGLGSGRRASAFVASRAIASFSSVRFPDRDPDLLAVWKYENERRQIAALAALDPTFDLGSVRLRASVERPPPVPAARARLAWETIRFHARGGDFLVAARVAETVGYYLRMLPGLERSRASAVLVSSDANPYAVALVAAARRLGKKTCFVVHGHVAEGPAPLDFDLSVLDGPAQRDVYERAGPLRGAVVYRGSEGAARPMRISARAGDVRTLGVVCSILVDWRRMGERLERLRAELSPARIVLRLHPNRAMRDPRWARHLRLDGVRVSEGDRPLADDLDGCALVAAGNTSAHLSALKLGVPTVYVPGLDEVGEDYYGFVRDGIVAAARAGGPIDARAIARFYEDPDWPARFARFDAAYPDRQAACDRAVVASLRALLVDRPDAAVSSGARPEPRP